MHRFNMPNNDTVNQLRSARDVSVTSDLSNSLVKTMTALTFLLVGTFATSSRAASLDAIKARGTLLCPVPTAPYPGFSEIDAKGRWTGLDIDICRSIATALLGAPSKAEFVPISWADRVPAIQSGAIDILVMLTSWVRSRDVKLGLQFSNPYYYDGAQLMVPFALNVYSAKGLYGATICAISGSTATSDVDDYLRGLAVKHDMLTFDRSSSAEAAYQAGRCEAIAQFGAGNGVFRATQLKVSAHRILPEVIAMEPQSVAVKQGDDSLLDMVNWTIAALVEADILGITSQNLDQVAADPKATPEQKRLLGVIPGIGSGFGLDDRWAYRVIKSEGNYGEIFDRNLGQRSPYKMAPGFNQPWIEGGLLVSPAFD